MMWDPTRNKPIVGLINQDIEKTAEYLKQKLILAGSQDKRASWRNAQSAALDSVLNNEQRHTD